MTRTSQRGLVVGAVALLLAACGGGGGGGGFQVLPPSSGSPGTPTQPAAPKVVVDDLPAGSYVVSSGDINAPTVGKYYAAADGSRLLVFGDIDDRAKQSYRRSGSSAAWIAVPPSDKDVTVTLLQSNAVPAAAAALATLAGRYRMQTPGGAMADFSVSAEGVIAPGSSACKLAGKLSAGVLPNTLKLDLAAGSSDACAGVPAVSSGVAVFDSDYAPAKLRLVADNGTQLFDLWAYAD